MKEEKNLLYNSDAYYDNNDFYELFSIREDSEGKIDAYFKNLEKCEVILDAGCGTGKYLNTLESISNKYIGIDLSKDQLKKAATKINKDNTELIHANLTNIPLPDNSVDLIISCWVLGTITDPNDRNKALLELKRVLKPNGKMILIENDEVGEFEELRNHHIDGKTKIYNNWLKDNGLKELKNIDTKFVFDTKTQAQNCIKNIYGDIIASKIDSNIIEHKIVIFSN